MKKSIRFFLDHQDLYRHWSSVADIAVLRTFAEQFYGPRKYYPVEQGLIQGHAAWRIIFNDQLDDLASYGVLVAPDEKWLTSGQKRKIARFTEQGGKVVRSADAAPPDTLLKTVRDRLRVVVDAPPSVAMELRRQSKSQRVLLHLVNYDTQKTIHQVTVRLRMKGGTPRSVRLFSPDPPTDRDLPFEITPEGCSLVVPELKIYAAILIEGIEL